jgi:outer membrane lipoprotein-sorting protein
MTALLTLLAVPQANPPISEFIERDFRDATFVAKKVRGDQRELKKINDDFGQSYRFDSTKVQIKEPFMLRLESVVDETSVLYILNGPNLLIRVPRLRLTTRQNLSKAPGRRQTTLDFGILTPSLFDGSLFEAKFVRIDRGTGNAVYDVTYLPVLDDTSRHRIWIDREKKYVTKREWYNQPGRQLATFFYEEPVYTSKVWLPTRMTVRNVEGKVAGITKYESFKINSGLEASLFAAK